MVTVTGRCIATQHYSGGLAANGKEDWPKANLVAKPDLRAVPEQRLMKLVAPVARTQVRLHWNRERRRGRSDDSEFNGLGWPAMVSHKALPGSSPAPSTALPATNTASRCRTSEPIGTHRRVRLANSASWPPRIGANGPKNLARAQ